MLLNIRIVFYLLYILLIIKAFKKNYPNNNYTFNITLYKNVYFIKINIYIYFFFNLFQFYFIINFLYNLIKEFIFIIQPLEYN